MPYAILRFQKRKAGGVAACERHNERKKEAYKSNPDIDMERSKDNYHLVNPPRYTYKKEINRMVAEAESVFYDGSGFHFRACRGEKYPLRSRPHGRENAAYAPLFCADYTRQ